MKLQLTIFKNRFTIHRFQVNYEIPNQVYESKFYAISKTEDELSIVCSSSIQLNSDKSESDWSCIKVLGPLDFSLTGILAEISAVLAKAKISIFAVSTFDTDYILVKSKKLPLAKKVLLKSGHAFNY